MIEVTQEEQEDKARKDLRSTVNEIIEDVAREICDHYCKYPEQWDAEKEEMELIDSDICINCPLSRL